MIKQTLKIWFCRNSNYRNPNDTEQGVLIEAVLVMRGREEKNEVTSGKERQKKRKDSEKVLWNEKEGKGDEKAEKGWVQPAA